MPWYRNALVPKRPDAESPGKFFKVGAETSRAESSRCRNDLVPKRLLILQAPPVTCSWTRWYTTKAIKTALNWTCTNSHTTLLYTTVPPRYMETSQCEWLQFTRKETRQTRPVIALYPWHVSAVNFLSTLSIATSWNSSSRIIFSTPWFHGFREKRSWIVINNIAFNMQKGTQNDVVVMDLAKAFGKVAHNRVLYKLSLYGVKGNTLDWIGSFLGGRSQRVVLEGKSSSVPVLSGVPQGCLGSSTISHIYINDLPEYVTNRTVRLL